MNTITVAGVSGAGKSVVAYHIQKMLKEKFNVDAKVINEVDDGVDPSRCEDHTKFNLRNDWQIKEIQLSRESLDA
jgi:ABC-type glutathione transport system ATPase component